MHSEDGARGEGNMFVDFLKSVPASKRSKAQDFFMSMTSSSPGSRATAAEALEHPFLRS